MISFKSLCKYLTVLVFSILAASAHAQSAAGNWDLTEPSGGPAIGKMILSGNGAINFDGTIGSWSQSGSHITATVYGSQKLRDANMPIAKLDFELHGDTMSGTMYNLVNKQTGNIAARRQGGSTVAATNAGSHPAPAPQQTIQVPCGKPGAINECVQRPNCKRGEALVDGKCVQPKISCLAPSVLQDGHCVRPAAAGNATGNAAGGVTAGASAGSGRDAKSCIAIRAVPQKGGIAPHQSITNTCSEDIGLIFCHSPSSKPGTRDTECGAKGRYYQQFTTMHAGQTDENGYTMPPDATIQYGACFGGESKIKQTTNGNYICR